MIPAKSDPKWTRLIDNLATVKAINLSTKMFLNRLKISIIMDPSPVNKRAALDQAFAYFTKNEALVNNEINLIFA